MALRAGRVGVRPDQVDSTGKVISGGGGGGETSHVHSFLTLSTAPDSTGATVVSGGVKFKPVSDMKIIAAMVYAKATTATWYLSESDGTEIKKVEMTGLTSGEWGRATLETPIELKKDHVYVMWMSHDSAKIGYLQGKHPMSTLYEFLGSSYGQTAHTFPVSVEQTSVYGVNAIIEI